MADRKAAEKQEKEKEKAVAPSVRPVQSITEQGVDLMEVYDFS